MNNSIKQIENFKSFKNELEQIEKINSWNKLQIELKGFEKLPIKISKIEKDFNLEITARIENHEAIKRFLFCAENKQYETIKIDHFSTSTNISIDSPASVSSIYKINTFQTVGFNSNGIFRTYYPVKLDTIKTFYSEFETITYQTETHNYGHDCLRICLNKIEYDIIQIKTKTKGFYIIENHSEMTFENYLNVCFSIKQAIGFISNFFPGDEEYIFDNLGRVYFSNFIRPTLKGLYKPISTNPYRIIEDKNNARSFLNEMTRISSNELSNLIFKIHTNSDFSTAILVILEASASKSLLLIPSSFAVIIELLSKTINVNENKKEYPIDDNLLKEKIIKSLHKVIDDNCNKLSDKSILKLKRRLNDINKPINNKHLTNNEKLTKPFEQLGIKLSINDVIIIEHRNDLLHGNILLKKDEFQSDENINLYMCYVSSKLYTLISKLILKSIGYNGYIFNNSKIYEKELKISTDENYFEKI